jgi:hypothetical protein
MLPAGGEQVGADEVELSGFLVASVGAGWSDEARVLGAYDDSV